VRRLLVTTVAAAALVTVACVNGESADAGHPSAPPTAKAGEVADRSAPGERPRAQGAAASQDVCALLPAAEVAELTGLPIERVEKKAEGCEWYAGAAAQQQKGAANTRDTFKKLTAQEPKSEQDAVHSMENLLNGLRGAAGPNQPVFSVTVQRGDVDQAELVLKSTVAMNGGRLESIEGLGDHAYAGPMGVFFYVRKGPALIGFGGVGTREQTLALARRIVPRIQ
jgi:hypothetical protein